MDRVIAQRSGVYVATQAALKHMKSGGASSRSFAVGERVAAPGLVPYAGTKGAVKMSLRRWPERSEAGHHGQQRAAPVPIDTELIPPQVIGPVPAEGRHSLERYGRVMRSPRWWRLSQSGVLVQTGANLTVDGE